MRPRRARDTPAAPRSERPELRTGDPGAQPPRIESLSGIQAFDIYGLPTITVPCGFSSSGLPIGLQISGNHFAESTVLALAHAYGRATPWHTRRPPP